MLTAPPPVRPTTLARPGSVTVADQRGGPVRTGRAFAGRSRVLPFQGPGAPAVPGHGDDWHDVRVPTSHRVLPPGRSRPPGEPPTTAGAGPSAATFDRRALLRVAGGGAFAIASLSAAACSKDKPLEPDALLPHEVSARTDAVWAQAAVATAPDRAAALAVIAAQRTAHADALRAEIDRAIGRYGDGTKPKSASPPVTPPAAPAPPPAVAALRDRITASQRSAADAAQSSSAYRAGLLASISACCASHVEVLLP